MKTELSPEDKQRIEQEAIRLTNWETGYTPLDKNSDFYKGVIKGAEYENKYQREQQADLLAKVSEQEKEITKLHDDVAGIEKERRMWFDKSDQLQRIVSEQSQRIQELTEQVELLRKGSPFTTRELEKRSDEISRLREERKELVEALRELYKCQPTMLTLIPDAALDFLDLPKKATLLKVESLLSKFEEHNQS